LSSLTLTSINDIKKAYFKVYKMRKELLNLIISSEESVFLLDLPITKNFKESLMKIIEDQKEIINRLEKKKSLDDEETNDLVEKFSYNLGEMVRNEGFLNEKDVNFTVMMLKEKMKNLSSRMNEKLRKKFLNEEIEEMKNQKERLENEEKMIRERNENEKMIIENIEKERIEKERIEKESIEKEIMEKERLEKERIEKERIEKERIENEIMEKEKIEKERLEKENIEKERIENEIMEKEKIEKERKEKLEKNMKELKKSLDYEKIAKDNNYITEKTKSEIEFEIQKLNEGCHKGYSCDICEKEDFKGLRYTCLSCKFYDVCEECFLLKLSGHNMDHIFDVFDEDQNCVNSTFVSLKHQNIHYKIFCDICNDNKDIVGRK
jgi:hypothetical protein